MTAYMTSLGKFLPGPPIDNESMEEFLGKIAGKASRARHRVTPEHFAIRSAFIAHTSDEHRDFEMLERNDAAVGGDLDAIRKGRKASQEDPFELIGAMFIVEGLGQRLARQWGQRIKEQLGLQNDAVSFFLYHSESDVEHFKRLDQVIASGVLTGPLVADIVRCARVTARLYALQLEEIGHF